MPSITIWRLFQTCAVCAAVAPAFAQSYVEFNVMPGASTQPSAINNNGDVAGVWSAPLSPTLGFLRLSDGTITSFQVLSAAITLVYGMNDKDEIVGAEYDTGTSNPHSFIRHSDGTIAVFDPPGYTTSSAYGINDTGTIVGVGCGVCQNSQGYLRNSDGTFTLFSVPKATSTSATSINGKGDVAGLFARVVGPVILHGAFLRTSDGTVTTFGGFNGNGDFPRINDSDQIAGDQLVIQGIGLGYYVGSVWSGGETTHFKVPMSQSTQTSGINNSGVITGVCLLVNQQSGQYFASFIRNSNGTIGTFEAPGGTETFAAAVNDSGVVTGGVNNGQAFIRFP